ncbi:MAG: hypothetical protein L6R40_004096 [Gallowayella cf. fulva]|nr:MAG: hypothetical protein L6R40_004096 [Xanthomendoza cf. fulva]
MTTSPHPRSIHLARLEELPELHHFYTTQWTAGQSPTEIITLITTQLTAIQRNFGKSSLDKNLRTVNRMTKVASKLGCHHEGREAEEACPFAKLHEMILGNIRKMDQKLNIGGSDEESDEEPEDESDEESKNEVDEESEESAESYGESDTSIRSARKPNSVPQPRRRRWRWRRR